ncbi:MoaA/NifB/PqqE/SkfB family radical SAM enzyme [Streptomyces sp. Ag109_O5-1]|uniref:radical SAM protein n=1 Tax=Streptomyces sp. Ag109_O5-1 TaxID=1938851 RepID=UPI000F4E9B84|nr:radical SAM protein [Streptomyces sp. Ag109_O5-1]RPE39971.1 MoaA/NifB/PqqE/SkfB family radical SAM enzyme [Streptomyces sp. Ag109_O5-1]
MSDAVEPMVRRALLDTSDNFSTMKLLAHPEVLVAARQPEPMRPINLEINPINICNQSCTWCTYGYLHERKEVLDKERMLELLEDARSLGVQSVTWTGGGEPTVHKDLDEVVERAAELGFRQGINSNGVKLGPRLRRTLVQHFSYIRFSVDAGTPDVYARTHRVNKALHNVVLRNITTLAAERDAAGSGLVMGFSFLVDESNVHDLAEGARRAKAAGVDYFQVKPIVHYERSNEQFEQESSLWTVLEEQMAQVRQLRDEHFDIRYLDHKFDDVTRQEDYGRTYDVCRGNELLATVGADGSVDVCCAFKGESNWSFGNINERRFTEIWAGEQRRSVLAMIDVKRCPPLCKGHELNKIIHFVNNFDAHREFP